MANTDPTLVIMAAGIGSRYGGLKQVDPIGPNGEIIIDYSIYDAIQTGFKKVVFLIRKDLQEIFHEKIGQKVEKHVETVYAFQELSHVPDGFQVPVDRKKPWGTGHAVLSCKDVVDQPFAVINADDFYGRGAFQILANYLKGAQDPANGPYDYSMVGYILRNTLSENGSVARGICEVSAEGNLVSVQERTCIERINGVVQYCEDGKTWIPISEDSIVSMNMFGFTPSIFTELEKRFPVFLKESASNPLKAEYFLPNVVNQLLRENIARVKILPTPEKWFGVTYPEDRSTVEGAIQDLTRRGVYPERLWA
jgi:NDP-sugar pyrophosphorylase family protein